MARRAPARRPTPTLALALAALVAAAALQLVRPTPAAAAVEHLHGFRATVAGFTSWYGSYGMGELGVAWCIDHGIRSPDPAYRYVPADLSAVPDDVRSALGWAVATHGQGTDRVAHAALMLALHDLMGAVYPYGRLDVDRLTVTGLAGFGGLEAQVLEASRRIKAEALARAGLRGPLRLSVEAGPLDDTGTSTVMVALRDAAGQGVGGIAVTIEGATLDSTSTAADGTIVGRVAGTAVAQTVRASADVPRLPVDAWAPTTRPAQRVARPVRERLVATAAVPAATGRLAIRKQGDAMPWLSVAGARFRVEPPEGGAALHTLTVDGEGAAPPVDLPIGTYRVVEEAAPAGYHTAGPWTVVVEHGRLTTLEVTDEARRARLSITKVDAATGAALAGASLTVRYDHDADGEFDQLVAELVSEETPTLLEGLLPGRYAIVETQPPTGYVARAEPLLVDVLADSTTEVEVANEALPAPVVAPPTTTTTTTTAAAPTPSITPPPTVLSARPAAASRGALPRTGVDALGLGLAGTGLVLLGQALRSLAPRRER